MDFAATQIGRLWIEQSRKCPQDASLRLAAQAEQDEIMPGKNRIDDLGNDRVVIPNDPGKNGPFIA